MARPALMPIAAAVALTLASALSLAAEHAGSSPAAALALPSTGDGGGYRKAAPPPPAVGSRALAGSEDQSSQIGPARTPAYRVSE